MAKSQTVARVSQRTRRPSQTVERSTLTTESVSSERMIKLRRTNRAPRRIPSPAILLGYSVSAVMTVTGIAVIAGLLMKQGVPEKFRLTFGVVLTLMGVYRFVLTRMKQIQKLREEEDEE